MAYEFDTGAQHISYGTHEELYQAQDLTVTFFVQFVSGVNNDFHFLLQADAFPIIQCNVIATVGNGYGVRAAHIKGGAFAFVCDCVPGLVNPAYKLNAGSQMYFGFTRDFPGATYFSYFGTRSAVVAGPTATWAPGQAPFPITQPGQTLGPWYVGNQVNGILVGPASYWSRPLTLQEHQQMAQCVLPSNQSGLLWFTKMFSGAADLSPNHWPVSFSSPPPVFVPDNGCAPAAAGDDYRVYNS